MTAVGGLFEINYSLVISLTVAIIILLLTMKYMIDKYSIPQTESE